MPDQKASRFRLRIFGELPFRSDVAHHSLPIAWNFLASLRQRTGNTTSRAWAARPGTLAGGLVALFVHHAFLYLAPSTARLSQKESQHFIDARGTKTIHAPRAGPCSRHQLPHAQELDLYPEDSDHPNCWRPPPHPGESEIDKYLYRTLDKYEVAENAQAFVGLVDVERENLHRFTDC